MSALRMNLDPRVDSPKPSVRSQTGGSEHPSSATRSSATEGWILAHCDGGSRGNPGPAAYGVFIQDDKGGVLAELSEYLGRKTNNFAEYSGLLAAIGFALAHGHPRLRVISDSELMVKQMKGQYRVNSPDLRPLYEAARRLAQKLEQFQIQHVLREKNRQADRLANLAMDRGAGRDKAAGEPSRPATGRMAGPTARPTARPATLRGVVRSGVVQIVDGELPEGIVVRITPE
jgi:probable phosphoglycerate mutase